MLAMVLASDILSVYVTRRILDRINESKSHREISGLFLFDAVVALLCAGYPGIILMVGISLENTSSEFAVLISPYLQVLGIGALAMNLTTALPTFAYLFVAIIIFFNLIIWGIHFTKQTPTSCGYRFLVSGMFACIYRKRGLDFLKILETLCHNSIHYI